jgi:prepilin-type N-terminal cleavage/methylation domain-containing protein
MQRASPSARRGGFTLIEIAIAMGILGLVLSSVIGMLSSSSKGFNQGSTSALVQNDARRTLDRLAVELENAGLGTLLPNPVGIAADDLVFQIATGVNEADGTIVFGTSTRLRFVFEPGELVNGLDDDGDGLVDEGCVVLTRNYFQANELNVTLARRIPSLLEGEIGNGIDDNGNGLVDERGFAMTREGDLLRLRLSMMRAAPDGNVAITTVETALRLKN